MIDITQQQKVLSRASFAKDLCGVLNDAGITYGILHGAEGFPNTVGRDFDILIPEYIMAEAVGLLRRKAEALGWRAILAPIYWAGAPLFFWKSDQRCILTFEMHFIARLEWGGTVLAKPEKEDVYRDTVTGLYQTRYGGFAKRVLIQVLAGCWDRMAERINEISLTEDEKLHVYSHSEALFGEELTRILVKCVKQKDLNGIKSISLAMRRKILLRAINPFSPVQFSFRWLVGKICRKIGWINWKLPNLVIASESTAYSEGVLADVIRELSFINCMRLSNEPPYGQLNRLRERYKIRLHRALFRYAALAQDRTTQSQVADRFGNSSANSGNLLFILKNSHNVVSIKADFLLGKMQKTIDIQVAKNNCSAIIASIYLSAAQATCDGIEHYGIKLK